MTTLTMKKTASLDWQSLKQQAAPYTNLVSTTDPVSGLVDITYYGLQTSLSEVLKNAPASGAHSVAIFADTLLLDVPAFTTSGLLLAVRNLDVTGLNGQTLMLTPRASSDVVAQTLIGATVGGTFSLGVAGHETSNVAPPTGTNTINVTSYVAAQGQGFSPLPSTGNSVDDSLLGSAWMMNSMYASFTAAAWLMNDTSSSSAAAAQAMLAWIVACTSSLATNATLPSDYSQLYNQAAALLVTLNVAPGATFVPVLSGTYYSQHTSDIITVIRDYESYMMTLDTQSDIAQAIATVSSTLQSVATDEITPLQVQLDSISSNAESLFSDIQSLRNEFQLQTQRAHTAFLVMTDEITLGEIKATLEASLDMVMSAVSFSFNAVKASEGDISAVKDAINDAVNSIKGLVNTIEAGQGSGSTEDLSEKATALLNTQAATLQVVLNARVLFQQAIANQSGAVLPASLSAITIDPVTDWDNYIASAVAEVNVIQRGVTPQGQDAADDYLASLKILAGYGKALSGKYVAYIAQLVQATIVMAQIKAAKDVEQRWADTKANATSDVQKLAALKALVLGRTQAVKRSLYLAWTYYAASYFYLNFQSPPRLLNMGMNAAQLEAALIGVSDWVAQAISSSPDGQHVQLPSDNANIELDFAILQSNGTSVSGDAALLSKLQDGTWSLVFTVPLGTDQLDGVLPDNGNVAMWIKEVSFFLDGITPNSKGNVIANISTSGTYQNGFGDANSHTFVTKGLTGNYAYRASDNSIYSPWAINTSVYMTPAPYTQWNITFAANSGDPSTATRLRVRLTTAYMSSNS